MPSFEVGKLYLPGHTWWEEAVEYNFFNGNYELRLFFRKPSPQEIQAVKSGKSEFALVVQGDVIDFLFRFYGVEKNQRGVPWSDCPYTWHILAPEQRKTLPIDPNAMNVETRALLQTFLVNADTGILLAIRAVSLSHEFTVKLHRAILDQAKKPFDKVLYDRQVRALQAQYQESKDMLRIAIARCEGGA